MNPNLYAVLQNGFRHALDEPFLRVPGRTALTYRDVDLRSAAIAGALVELGVTRGDRVVVQVHKSTDAVALYLACLRLGAVFVTLNTAYTDAEVSFFVKDASPTVLVRSPDNGPVGQARFVTLDVDGTGTLADAADRSVPFAEIVISEPDSTAAMLYTSGTTGRSKGAMLTHRGLTTNGQALHEMWGFSPGDVLLHALPVFHVHGLFVALHPAMLNGSEVIFLPRFSSDAVIAELAGATVFMGVPTHYTRLMADPKFSSEACATMRLFTSGSAPMTALVHEEFQRRSGHRILERYGMTETGIITSNPLSGNRVAGTVGFAMPGFEVQVCDEHGAPVETGTAGGVEIRGPGLFAGYWQLPERTASEFRSDGYFKTGDIGVLDTEGRLTLEGRSGDMIISGGLNIYPREVEMALDTLPGVVESAVIGLPHPDYGEAPVAFVVTEDGVELSLDQAREALGASLARFKLPRDLIRVSSLPRNTMAKVQNSALRVKHAHHFEE